MWHQHQWEVVARVVTPPRKGEFKLTAPTREVLERTMFGFTTIETKCTTCGKREWQHVLGEQTGS